MCQRDAVTDAATTDRATKIDAICAAAVPVFAAQGFRGTSMADVAAAAGVSRPALYQYFDNRADLFRAAFAALLENSTEQALAALTQTVTVVDRLDGYLQRLSGDVYEQLATTTHGDELMEAKHEFAADVAAAAITRAHVGLRDFLTAEAATGASVDAVVELLTLSPVGLKSDRPEPEIYRSRLRSLAAAGAALLSD
jgi:AcrR family transcriptional regulator